MIGGAQWQIEHIETGPLFNPQDGIIDGVAILARHHKPEIEPVFALIIVVYAGLRVYDACNLFKPGGRHGHGGKRAGACGVGRHHRSNPRKNAGAGELSQHAENRELG